MVAQRPRPPAKSRPAKSKLRAPAPAQFVDPESDDAGDDGAQPALVRLNKYLADRGVASRRKCDELIAQGKVSVDGEPLTALGTRIDPERQAVEINGVVLKPEGMRRRYYLLNKPPGVVCTNEEREVRPRAVDLITDPRKGRIYTVGRLDEESKGLILLTNDGTFANRVMHPRYGTEKTYAVKVAGQVEDETLDKIREGVHLSEGRTSGARIFVERRGRDYSLLTIVLREGMNREIRRVFARFGSKVVDLRRTRIGNLTERGIKVGRWRELTPAEVNDLIEGRASDAADAGARPARRPPPRDALRRPARSRPPLARGGRPATRDRETSNPYEARDRKREHAARERGGSPAAGPWRAKPKERGARAPFAIARRGKGSENAPTRRASGPARGERGAGPPRRGADAVRGARGSARAPFRESRATPRSKPSAIPRPKKGRSQR